MGMLRTIAITTTSFGQYDGRPVKLLKEQGFNLRINSLGRMLKSPNEVVDLLNGCVGVIAGTENYDQSTLEQLEGLKIISRCGIGTDNIDMKFCEKRGIHVFNTPQGVERAVAELVVGLILNLLRHISFVDRQLREEQWTKMMGELLLNKKIGLVGFGQVGQEVGRLLYALKAKVYYCDPVVQPSVKYAFARKLDFENLLSECDIISLHVPLTPQTKYLMNKQSMGLMKAQAVLINTSRGGVVEEDALYQALKERRLEGAALDVFEEEPYKGPLSSLDNVILTPHIGSYAREVRIQMELQAAQNLLTGFKK